MQLSVIFWILMLLWLVFGFVPQQPPPAPPYLRYGGTLLLFILLAILGWAEFGAAVKR